MITDHNLDAMIPVKGITDYRGGKGGKEQLK